MQTLFEERIQAMALLQAGMTIAEVANQLGRSQPWVRKWQTRFTADGYAGLKEQSRAPKRPGKQLSPVVRRQVIAARMQLEAVAKTGKTMKYIGGQAVRTMLKEQGCQPLPSVPTIERILRTAGLTRQKAKRPVEKVAYPHLKPTEPHLLLQVDIVPHYLTGGQRVACFNAIDVVSRYPTGQAFATRRSEDAAAFLVHAWQTIGIPRYTQVDNEGCFSGGSTHRYVLGRVVRLALAVGTELVFSPVYHPESNGYIERFHQDYDRHVWDDTYLAHMAQVNRQGMRFFARYRQSCHHSQLAGQAPADRHQQPSPRFLPTSFLLPMDKQPLHTGRVHFIRRVQSDRTIRLLNVDWSVPATVNTGVWATLTIDADAAWIHIYDAAPDNPERRCLTIHPFPLKEAVVTAADAIAPDSVESDSLGDYPESPDNDFASRAFVADLFFAGSIRLLQKPLVKTWELAAHLLE